MPLKKPKPRPKHEAPAAEQAAEDAAYMDVEEMLDTMATTLAQAAEIMAGGYVAGNMIGQTAATTLFAALKYVLAADDNPAFEVSLFNAFDKFLEAQRKRRAEQGYTNVAQPAPEV